MNKADEYRRYAVLCQRMADESTRESDKSEWLSLARAWLCLVRTGEWPAFDAERITDQEESKR